MKRDLVIIGGGHAGCEAVKAATNLGLKPVLITNNIETIGVMSCNPAMGGLAKGHVVKELDALSGLMPKVTDMTTIQRRTLNASKGAAVQATRAQCDKRAYNQTMIKEIMNLGIEIIQGEVSFIDIEGNLKKITLNSGIEIFCRAVVVTSGTFLKGLMHMGEKKLQGGRFGETGCNTLTDSLHKLGIKTMRLKTGTPPRILKSSINFDGLFEQPSDDTKGFHWSNDLPTLKHTSCFLTTTNEKTHEIILNAKSRSPMYNGEIKGVGPRYCPSIEDKVVRFAHKRSHHIFLEPEGLDSVEIYPNGISTSLPIDVQMDFVRTIKGLENAVFTRPGYAVEYDAVCSYQLSPTLELRDVPGFFSAGQINGTSGYEEAGGQGYLAGLNAALFCLEKDPVILDRHESYIGVMVDDLIRWKIEEPYRLFTCRSESRLMLREDNAYERFENLASTLNLWTDSQKKWFYDLKNTMKSMKHQASNTFYYEDNRRYSLIDKVKQLKAKNYLDEFKTQFSLATNLSWSDYAWEKLTVEERYAGYIKKENEYWDKISNSAKTQFPNEFDFDLIEGLSNEMKNRIKKYRPRTIGDLLSMDGINPSAALSCHAAIVKWNKRVKLDQPQQITI